METIGIKAEINTTNKTEVERLSSLEEINNPSQIGYLCAGMVVVKITITEKNNKCLVNLIKKREVGK